MSSFDRIAKRLILGAVRRRQQRAVWVYGVVGALYVFSALLYAGQMGSNTVRGLWFLAIPALVIIGQIAYPTVLGWALVLAGTGFYSLAGMYYLIRNALLRYPPQWSTDPGGFWLGMTFTLAPIAVSVALLWNRPRRADGPGQAPLK